MIEESEDPVLPEWTAEAAAVVVEAGRISG
jgi:hypothetical protein